MTAEVQVDRIQAVKQIGVERSADHTFEQTLRGRRNDADWRRFGPARRVPAKRHEQAELLVGGQPADFLQKQGAAARRGPAFETSEEFFVELANRQPAVDHQEGAPWCVSYQRSREIALTRQSRTEGITRVSAVPWWIGPFADRSGAKQAGRRPAVESGNTEKFREGGLCPSSCS